MPVSEHAAWLAVLLMAVEPRVVEPTCITFQEAVTDPSAFACTANASNATHSRMSCTTCQRRCTTEQASDCASWEQGTTECPKTPPTTGENCTSTAACAYAPYCGLQFIGGGTETCTFLVTAQCTAGMWQVLAATTSAPRHPTCMEIKLAFAEQSCCASMDGPFDLTAITTLPVVSPA